MEELALVFDVAKVIYLLMPIVSAGSWRHFTRNIMSWSSNHIILVTSSVYYRSSIAVHSAAGRSMQIEVPSTYNKILHNVKSKYNNNFCWIL